MNHEEIHLDNDIAVRKESNTLFCMVINVCREVASVIVVDEGTRNQDVAC
jgi:hypothetical protein